ncbi:DUF4258 domain-containing protein [Rhodohalobacter sp. 614A]|uniref:DUF4258 domain-containing protein n=1 Tax=Rhodohalobacter sp. 614A TaxID=2908649 RepID=UPI001F1B320F|nr:DUF4258 domain-containing protein [Rhodohalobacter sp. 614A]
MKLIEEIRLKIGKNRFEFSKHAVDQSIMRDISVQEVREVVLGESKIIENYPEDKYGPSCLIFGYTTTNRPIHIQCSYPSRDILKIITLYEPDPEKWLNFENRK